jgi:hypothetical protein
LPRRHPIPLRPELTFLPSPSPLPVLSDLQIDASDVEAWVVKAIARGLLSARMDQLTSTVTVLRTMQREFGEPQWKHLQERLHAWRDNVAALLSTVEATVAAARST